MGDAIGQMLPSAVGIAISPMPMIAVILMLATPNGRTNGLAFATGWTVSLAVAATALVLLGTGADAANEDGGPAAWTSWLKLALGVLFLLLAFKQFRSRPREGHPAHAPKWMAAIDRFTPAKAVSLASLLAVANPKNLVLILGGTVAIAGSGADPRGKTVAVVVMVLVASLCTAVPVAVFLFGGTRAAQILNGWKTWMSAHTAAIMTVLFAVLGSKYVGDAMSGLTH
ncbi:GAP family protein (plasmid) [Streptomyces xanthophaeus]|uniref:GAP family protein n=1 Tax=Streptomyces xanthophaeus TaxID=67385 RepID=UPI0039900002